ncbi:MAG: tetratricopeptide repeat protein [Oscillatoriales cyanobacterium]|nr:MAG: tetratricopeptide repeat protein [Oscillatoriales cyanobacterium]
MAFRLATLLQFPSLFASGLTIATVSTLGLLGFPTIARSENLADLQQLLSSKQCSLCNLNNAGLVYANLAGADLSGSQLVRSNLSQSDLSGANLANANLTGASLAGSNLMGADLSGANLAGANLSGAYLTDANFSGANLSGANLRGALDIPLELISLDQLLLWGNELADRGNYTGAIAYYSQALAIDPDYGEVYLARGAAYNRLGDLDRAKTDADQAAEIFFTTGNQEGYEMASLFVTTMEAEAEAARDSQNGRSRGNVGGNLLNVITGIGSLLLRSVF